MDCVGDMDETVTMHAVEGLVQRLLEEKLTASVAGAVAGAVAAVATPLEHRIMQLERQVAELTSQRDNGLNQADAKVHELAELILQGDEDKKEADAKVADFSVRLQAAEATIALLQLRTSEADARSFAECKSFSASFSDIPHDMDTSSNASETRRSPLAVSAIFGGLRHYVQALIRRGPGEPGLGDEPNPALWV